MNLPTISLPSHSNHEKARALRALKLVVIVSSDFDFSRTPMMSPGRSLYEGDVNHFAVHRDVLVQYQLASSTTGRSYS